MELVISPERKAMIQRQIASGRFADISEVVEEALRLLEERDRLNRLRAAIAIGDAQPARGEVIPWTADSMERLIQEADEENCQGLPIAADVLP